jgi:hypothetical protein
MSTCSEGDLNEYKYTKFSLAIGGYGRQKHFVFKPLKIPSNNNIIHIIVDFTANKNV